MSKNDQKQSKDDQWHEITRYSNLDKLKKMLWRNFEKITKKLFKNPYCLKQEWSKIVKYILKRFLEKMSSNEILFWVNENEKSKNYKILKELWTSTN